MKYKKLLLVEDGSVDTEKIPRIIEKMHVHEVAVEEDEIIIRLLGTKKNEKLIKKLKTRGRDV